MTPRAQELLDKLNEMRAARDDSHEVGTRVRERVIVEKFDHEMAETPVLVETVELVFVNGAITDRKVTTHVPPVGASQEG